MWIENRLGWNSKTFPNLSHAFLSDVSLRPSLWISLLRIVVVPWIGAGAPGSAPVEELGRIAGISRRSSRQFKRYDLGLLALLDFTCCAKVIAPNGDLALEMLKAKSVSSPARVLVGVPKLTPDEFEVIKRPLPLAVTILHVVFSLGEIDVMLMLRKD